MEDASLELGKEPLHASNLATSNLVQPAYETTWFDREKERLTKEIAHEFEQALNNSNMLGRRLEEVLGVGKEFKTIAALWGVFGNIVGTSSPVADDDDESAAQSMHQNGGVPGTGSSNYYASRG